MKTFEVEFRRTSYITYTIEAADPLQAQYLAFEALEKEGADDGYADWTVESVEEMQPADQPQPPTA